MGCVCPGGWRRLKLAALKRNLCGRAAVPCVPGCPIGGACPDGGGGDGNGGDGGDGKPKHRRRRRGGNDRNKKRGKGLLADMNAADFDQDGPDERYGPDPTASSRFPAAPWFPGEAPIPFPIYIFNPFFWCDMANPFQVGTGANKYCVWWCLTHLY